MFGPNDNVSAVIASLQVVLGPGEVQQYYMNGDARYRVVGYYRQRAFEAEVHTDANILHSVEFGVDLGGLPITLLLNHRKNTTIVAVPEVRTGDADFDQTFLLNGFPSEVLCQALDVTTRAWLLDRFREKTPTLETEQGRLRLLVVLRTTRGAWALHSGREIPPEEIAAWLDALLAIADRLTGAFRSYAEYIAATQGPAAAQQWIHMHTSAMTARANRRRNLRILLLGLFVGIPLLIVLAVAFVILLVALVSFSGG